MIVGVQSDRSVPPKIVKSERFCSITYLTSHKKGQENFSILSGKHLLISLSNTIG